MANDQRGVKDLNFNTSFLPHSRQVVSILRQILKDNFVFGEECAKRYGKELDRY